LRTNLNNKIEERERLVERAMTALEHHGDAADVLTSMREQLAR
jgi:hypothetical protein